MSGEDHSVCTCTIIFCVTYVCSLPRHKPSGAIKGFSFIEFTTTEEAAAALEVCHYIIMFCVLASAASTCTARMWPRYTMYFF